MGDLQTSKRKIKMEKNLKEIKNRGKSVQYGQFAKLIRVSLGEDIRELIKITTEKIENQLKIKEEELQNKSPPIKDERFDIFRGLVVSLMASTVTKYSIQGEDEEN